MSSPNPNNPVPNFFLASAAIFKKIPGSPIAYWVSEEFVNPFVAAKALIHDITISDGQTKTGDNDKFLRQHWEVSSYAVGIKGRWWQHPKGGPYRKWYGNVDWIIDWSEKSRIHYRKDHVARILPDYLWGRKGISWTLITSGEISFRTLEPNQIFNLAAPSLFFHDENNINKCLGFLNSKYALKLLKVINPTLNMNVGEVRCLPLLSSIDSRQLEIEFVVEKCLSISKSDWDSYETSWDFSCIPLLHPDHHQPTLKATYEKICANWQTMTQEMQRLEEENNRIFINAYGLQDELTPDVPLSEITLTCNPHYRYGGNKTEEELETQLQTDTMKELISYAIGSMMGRYRLDRPGLIYAHSGNKDFEKIYHRKDAEDVKKEENSASRQEKDADLCEAENPPLRSLRLCGEFPPDDDGIIPILDIPWFSDDAANRFVEFMKAAWPPETLNENLQFVADTLSPKRGEGPIDTIRRYLSTGFFKDHLKTYKKRPIYWLFSSGRQKAFECLVYLHRYNESTLSRMRSLYVTPLQGNIRSRIEFLDNEQKAAASASDQRKFQKEMDMLKKKQIELAKFDDELRHYADMRISLDLDDGVKVNYGKFGSLLAEVKAITGE
jgi:type II restriction/modification system DNA methylase subunit YeeA